MAYYYSDQIRVFPSVNRGETDRDAREFSEENIVRTSSFSATTPSFLLECSGDANQTGQIDWLNCAGASEFCIHGYWFKIQNMATFKTFIDENFSQKTAVWACIYLNQSGYIQLQGQDDNALYQGLSFETDLGVPVQGETIGGLSRYFLKILERTSASATWVIPSTAYNRTTSDTEPVDGGYWTYDRTSKAVGSLDRNGKVYKG